MKIVIASALLSFDQTVRTYELLRYLSTQDHQLLVFGPEAKLVSWQIQYPQHQFFMLPEADEISGHPEDTPPLAQTIFESLRLFSAQVVVVDGISPVEMMAHSLKIPILSLDPTFLFQFGHFDITLPPSQFQELMQLKEQIRLRQCHANTYLIPNWFTTSFRSAHAVLTQPLLHHELASAQPVLGDTMLVFATPSILSEIQIFSTLEQPALIHISINKHRSQRDLVLWEREVKGTEGQLLRRRKQQLPQDLDQAERLSQLPDSTNYITYRLAQHDTWRNDLLTCKAVVSDGNPMIIAEAVHLRKPLLVIPKTNDFASWCHAQYVERMGLGESHSKLTRSALEGFLLRQERYREQIQSHHLTQPQFFTALEQQLSRYQERRKRPAPTPHSHRPKDRQAGSHRTHHTGSRNPRREHRDDRSLLTPVESTVVEKQTEEHSDPSQQQTTQTERTRNPRENSSHRQPRSRGDRPQGSKARSEYKTTSRSSKTSSPVRGKKKAHTPHKKPKTDPST